MEYKDVPWYRRNSYCGVFVCLGIFIFPPFLWIVLYSLATGDIYFNKIEDGGGLKKWSRANKIVAWIFILIQIFVIIAAIFN